MTSLGYHKGVLAACLSILLHGLLIGTEDLKARRAPLMTLSPLKDVGRE